MKKMISKIRKWLCNYHKKRYEKLFAKMIGVKKYYLNLNFSLDENEYMAIDEVETAKAFKNFCAWKEKYKNKYHDTDSVKNR